MKTRSFIFYKDPDAIKQISIASGFGYWACLFGPLWLAYHKLWLPLLITSAAMIAAAITLSAWPNAITLTSFSIHIIIGFSATFWRERKLRKQGYQLISSIPARNREEAAWRLMQLSA